MVITPDSLDKKIARLAKVMDNMKPLDITVGMLDDVFPHGYHLIEVNWTGDEDYTVVQKNSKGYLKSYGYDEVELPMTMASKYTVARKEEVDESNVNFDHTILTKEPTSGYIVITHKSGKDVKYFYRNVVTDCYQDGRAKTVLGYQVRC